MVDGKSKIYMSVLTENFRKMNFMSLYIHTYHSRYIPEGVAEASQIFLPGPRFTKII
jgi:hypothetical protein